MFLRSANDERSVVGKSRRELVQVSVVWKNIATMKMAINMTVLILLLFMLGLHIQILVDHFDADLVRLEMRNIERNLNDLIGRVISSSNIC